MATKVLIVEDDLNISNIIKFNLEQDGHVSHQLHSGDEVLPLLNLESFDLVLLDLMLPFKNGYEVLSDIRKTHNIPVIIVSAKESEEDIVKGLDLGADDYVTKPFPMEELKARVRTNIRRTYAPSKVKEELSGYLLGDLEIDTLAYQVKNVHTGEEIKLTLTEYKVLLFFIENTDKVYTREQILTGVWGQDGYYDIRTVDVMIRRIREKIETGDHKYILTKRGVGYYSSGLATKKLIKEKVVK